MYDFTYGEIMEFRYPTAVAATNAKSLQYLTENLSDPESGRVAFEQLLTELGNSIDDYPDWHPILTIPQYNSQEHGSLHNLSTYEGNDHTVRFVKGFVTCPYDKAQASKLVKNVNATMGLYAYYLDTALYCDSAYPVVVKATDVELEADGTIRSRDALAWCVQGLVKDARNAQMAESWWNLKQCLLGSPHGSRSSILVNQHTGGHIRKILEALNNSGMYGPIREWSLDMLSKKKRNKISETLIRTAINKHSNVSQKFEFELRGETCKAEVRDTWDDGTELSVKVMIGDFDLYVNGNYYPKKELLELSDPKGKRSLAEKFL
ncbi:hypothetical protein ACMFGH_05695 [Morganella morganii]|uniref:hypothetical protein n=2 Tax=Morganella morganii TaxID=582 RepID=UPI003CECBE0C|nr:hypothetical protein [Morganella morganii]